MVYLDQQLNEMRPQLVLCMGNVAVKWFFGDINAEVKNLRGIRHTVRNIPTVVTYHPLAVRRRPNLMRNFIEDWSLLAQCYKS
jgi:DNA polymerase